MSTLMADQLQRLGDKPALQPVSPGELMDQLRWCEDALRALRAVTAAPATKNVLARVIDELRASRTAVPAILAKAAPRPRPEAPRQASRTPITPAAATRRFSTEEARHQAKNDPVTGRRHCPRHNSGAGAWLPVGDFDYRAGSTGPLRFCCRSCWRTYQRERYVAANKMAIILEVLPGDQIVGATCNGCGRRIEIGDLIAATDYRHRECTT